MAEDLTDFLEVTCNEIKIRKKIVEELAPLSKFFMKHFHIKVNTKLLITSEGHFAVSYSLRPYQTVETVVGEASYTTTFNLRTFARAHMLQLVSLLKLKEPLCKYCALRHRKDICPRVPCLINLTPCVVISHDMNSLKDTQ